MKIKGKNIILFNLKLLSIAFVLQLINPGLLKAADTLYGEWNSHCYIVISNSNGFDWDESNLISTQMGGYLATIENKAENDFLFNLIKNNQESWKKTGNKYLGSWLGAYQEIGANEPGSGWYWISGEDFIFTNWANGEPDEFNNENENRICFYGVDEPQSFWNDYPDSKKLNSFIVEIDDVLQINAGDEKLINIGDSVILGANPTAIGKNKPFQYLWTPITGLDNPNTSNPKASPKHTTMYYLTVFPKYGCPAYDSVLVKVNSPEILVTKPEFEPLICSNLGESSIEIKNIGTQQLNIKEITITGIDKDEFVLKQAFQSFSLKSNESKSLIVIFQSNKLGVSNADITILSNSNPDSILVIKIKARKDTIDLQPANDFLDLGVICLNTSKDTVFTITNKGTIAVGGSIKTSPTLQVTKREFYLLPNESKDFQLHYSGSNQAIDINTQIKIIDSICNSINNIDIRIKVAKPEIYADKLFIVSTVGNPKESSLKIHNISDVDVYLNQPVVNDNRFQIINTQFPLEIPRNGFNTINFRYRPTDTNFIQLDLELSGYPCGVSTTAQLYGDAVDVVATLKIPDISAKSGQIIAIPIYLIDTVNYKISGYQGFDAELKFNSTLLVPFGNTPQGRIENGFRIIPVRLPFMPVGDSTLKTYKFLATLGNAERSVISLTNYKSIPDDNGIYLQVVSGNFTLLGICKEGGERLFEDTGNLFLSQNYPNPANDNTEITISIIEQGRTTLDIYNFLGDKIINVLKKELKTGIYNYSIKTAKLSSGIYFYVLKTPTQTKTKMMRIVH